MVRIGDSNLLEFLRRIKKQELLFPEIKKSENEIKKIRKNKNSVRAKERLEKLQYSVDKYLFIPEIISVVFDDNRHYKHLVNNGLYINGILFKRLYSGAGNARRSTAFFIDERYYEKMDWYLDCGRKELTINPNKYNAYYSLSSSAGTPITTPRFTVIPDLEIIRLTKVDFVTESTGHGIDPKIEEKEIQQTFSVFDGQGIMTPTFANQIAYDLELDYTPSSSIIRSAWVKGLLVCFDFKEFARQNNVSEIMDIYGNSCNVEELDVILTASQFKMSSGYDSLEQYKEEVAKRDFQWRVTRPSPKKDKNIVQTNYQYLQCLDLDDNSIERLCQPTINYLKEVSGLKWSSIILFLIGSMQKKDIDKKWFDRLDPLIKVLFYEPLLIENGFVRNKIKKMISKKIKESYIGVLNVEGNYSNMISDPHAFSQHAFGLPVTGLLNRREFYSNYWNKKNVKKVASLRSPLTWKSEINVLDLKKNEKVDYWYKYLTTGIIYNIFDESVMLHSGCDFDGDITCTTNNQEIINGASGGNPVTYERKTAPKSDIDKDKLWESDIQTFGGKIGFITNISSTLHSFLCLYNENSEEYKTIENRLKILTAFQSMSIDKAKGIAIMDFPDWWTKWEKGEDFQNKILADKRPYFFKNLYDHYNREYKKYLSIYDTFCISNYGLSLQQVKEKENRTKEQENTLYYLNRYNHLIDTPSVMNKICHYMEKEVSLLKDARNDMNFVFQIDEEKLEKMKLLYKEWKILRKKHAQDGESLLHYETKRKADEISVNSNEIAKLALNVSVGFSFSVFPEYVEGLYKKKNVEVPVLDENGDIKFDGEKYSLMILDLEEEWLE